MEISSLYKTSTAFMSKHIVATVSTALATSITVGGGIAISINPSLLNSSILDEDYSVADVSPAANKIASKNSLGKATTSTNRYNLEIANKTKNRYFNAEYGVGFEYDNKFQLDSDMQFIDFTTTTSYGTLNAHAFWLDVLPNYKKNDDLKKLLEKYLIFEKNIEINPKGSKAYFSAKKYLGDIHIANVYGYVNGIAGDNAYVFYYQVPLEIQLDKKVITDMANTFSFSKQSRKKYDETTDYNLVSSKLGIKGNLPKGINYISRSLDPSNLARKDSVTGNPLNATKLQLTTPIADKDNNNIYYAGTLLGQKGDLNRMVFTSVSGISNFERFIKDEQEFLKIFNSGLGTIKFTETKHTDSPFSKKIFSVTVNDIKIGDYFYIFANESVYIFYSESLVSTGEELVKKFSNELTRFSFSTPNTSKIKKDLDLKNVEIESLKLSLNVPEYYKNSSNPEDNREISADSKVLARFSDSNQIKCLENKCLNGNKKSFSIDVLSTKGKSTYDEFYKTISIKPKLLESTFKNIDTTLKFGRIDYQFNKSQFIIYTSNTYTNRTRGDARYSYAIANVPIKNSSEYITLTISTYGEDLNLLREMLNSISVESLKLAPEPVGNTKLVKSTDNQVELQNNVFTFKANRSSGNLWNYTLKGVQKNGCEAIDAKIDIKDAVDAVSHTVNINLTKTISVGVICTQAIKDYESSGQFNTKSGNGFYSLNYEEIKKDPKADLIKPNRILRVIEVRYDAPNFWHVNSPDLLSNQLQTSLKSAASKSGENLEINIVEVNNIPSLRPNVENNFEKTYEKILADLGLCKKIATYNIDQIWLWVNLNVDKGPGMEYSFTSKYFRENLKYPDGHTSKPFCNGDNSFAIMGFDTTRTFDLALHSFSHLVEGVVGNLEGVDLFWNKFVGVDNLDRLNVCGGVHIAPNGRAELAYDYDNTAKILNNCKSWNDPASVASNFDCSEWGCNQEGYLVWWLKNLPANKTAKYSNKFIPNWWDFITDFDNALLFYSKQPEDYFFDSSFIGSNTLPTEYKTQLEKVPSLTWPDPEKPCYCRGTNNLGQQIEKSCGSFTLGADSQCYVCYNTGWKVEPGKCQDDPKKTCSCSGTNNFGEQIEKSCGGSTLGKDNLCYVCYDTGWKVEPGKCSQ